MDGVLQHGTPVHQYVYHILFIALRFEHGSASLLLYLDYFVTIGENLE